MADYKMVYTIQENGEKSFWTKVGVAFVNKDGSFNVRLDALPVNGQLHIRDRKNPDSSDSNSEPRTHSPEPLS